MSINVSKNDQQTDVRGSLTTTKAVHWLALGAWFGPLLFTAAWLILGFVSPGYTLFGNWIAPYSPITQPISGLGMGGTAPFMNAAFVLSGLMMMAGVIGIHMAFRADSRRRFLWAGTALLLLSPLGLIIDGFFNLEAVFPHLIGFLLGTASPVFSFLAVGLFLRGIPQWRRFGGWLLLASPLTLILVALFFLTFDPMASGVGEGIAGVTQRILVIDVHTWIAALGWLVFKKTASA